MARNVTLATLKRMSRLYADQRPGGDKAFIDEDELTELVNGALADEYDLLVHAGGHERYLTTVPGYTVAGTATVDLPDDFYEAVSLHLAWSWTAGVTPTNLRDLERVNALDSLDDREDISNVATWARGSWKRYRRVGDTIEFFPTPSSVTAYELRYVPTFTNLVAEQDAFDGVNGWERMVEYRVAAEMLAIEGESPAVMMGLYQAEREKIEILAHQQTASSPERIRDVRYQNGGRRWNRLGPVPSGST